MRWQVRCGGSTPSFFSIMRLPDRGGTRPRRGSRVRCWDMSTGRPRSSSKLPTIQAKLVAVKSEPPFAGLCLPGLFNGLGGRQQLGDRLETFGTFGGNCAPTVPASSPFHTICIADSHRVSSRRGQDGVRWAE